MWQPMVGDSLYGNEWIDYEQADRYFKIKIAEDGIYRLSAEFLAAQGIPVEEINLNQYELYRNGQRVFLHVARATGNLESENFIEFYGKRNRSEIDEYLFKNPQQEMLNLDYSMFNDTSVYFLTWRDEAGEANQYSIAENDLSGNLPAPEPWIWTTARVNFNSHHFKTYEKISGFDVYYSHFDLAEGFASNRSANRDLTLNAPQRSESVATATLDLRLATNIGAHQLQISVDDEIYLDSTFNKVALLQPTFEVPLTENAIQINLKGALGSADQHVLASAKLRYARELDFQNENFYEIELSANNQKRLLNITNFGGDAEEIQLWDLTHQRIFTATRVGEGFQFLYPPTNQTARLLLVTDNAKKEVEQLEAANFINYSERQGDFIILSHPDFMEPTEGESGVQHYANYRASTIGGNYQPTIIDIEQLYDQFAYGIYSHPIAIRNFAHYVQQNWTNPQYFFLIGKGREYRELRTTTQFNAAHRKTFYLPTFGWPGADNLLLADNESATPIFPIGRIAVQNSEQLLIYLEKVKQHEAQVNAPQTIAGRAWMKELLHLGGARGAEAEQIRQYLNHFENIAERNRFGANVTSVYKTSTDPIQVARSETIFNRINQGVSMISFFGHSSPGSFDFNIDNPANYQNQGKYPLMLSFGCYSGNIFTPSTAISERFVFYENKGALAFGASRGLGFVSSLSQYGNRIYELASEELYGESIGKIFQQAAAHFADRTDIGMGILREQYTLQGDPALRLHSAEGADFVIDNASVQIEPTVVNVQQDSFKIAFEVVNLGLQIADSLQIDIEQQLPDGRKISLKEKWITTPANRQQIILKLPTQGKNSIGQNRLLITLDAANNITELPAFAAEDNNELLDKNGQRGIEFYVTDNTAFPIYPSAYGVVDEATVTLKASTTDAFAPERTYVFELATTPDFNVANLQRGRVTQGGGVVEWQPSANLQNGQTYYWRVSPDSLNTEVGYLWETSSFTYLADGVGEWHQQEVAQLAENELQQVELNAAGNGFKFVDDTRDIYVKNKIYDAQNQPEYVDNGTPFGSPWTWSIFEGMNFIVMRPRDSEYWRNPSGGDYESVNTANRTVLVYSYPTDTPENRKKAIDFLENIVPDEHYVIVYSALRTVNSDYQPEDWAADSLLFAGANLFNVLEKQGAQAIRKTETRGAVPYLLMYQKGVAVLDEAIAEDINDVITVNYAFPIAWFEGSMTTQTIGPANSWEEMRITFEPSSLTTADSLSIDIIGQQVTGQLDTLLTSASLAVDLSEIDAAIYPYLRANINFTDQEERTIPTIKNLTFTYQPAAELALNPQRVFELNDTLAAGEPIALQIGIENVNGAMTDSLDIQFALTSSDGRVQNVIEKYAPLAAKDTLTARLDYPTTVAADVTKMAMIINPNRKPLERTFLNNFGQLDLRVESDRSNPLLRVTFNQRSILQGDIIEPNSQIEVRLTDDNPYLLLTDTSTVEAFLTYPDGQIRRLAFANNTTTFTAATAERNELKVTFQPEFPQDGLYHLRVQGRDVTGNLAGSLAYEVDFEIVRKELISNVLAYPNPFTTSTKFVYTLTGETPPDHYLLQILSASGRVVRELTEMDLGTLKIGRHQTDFAWDGTDSFGERLANGVYLYRLILKNAAGEDYEQYATEADQYFKAGFGKVVLLR